MDEETIFAERGVTVTSKRFILPAQTITVAGITSVSMVVVPPKLFGPVLLTTLDAIFIVFGLFMLWVTESPVILIISLILFCLGVIWWISRKKKYSVVLASASGQVRALIDRDKTFIEAVIDALNKAIVMRD